MSCTTHVDDIRQLSKCAKLFSCDISWTSVTDLTPLADCRKLQLVDAQGCEEMLKGDAELISAGVRLSLRPTREVLRQRVKSYLHK